MDFLILSMSLMIAPVSFVIGNLCFLLFSCQVYHFIDLFKESAICDIDFLYCFSVFNFIGFYSCFIFSSSLLSLGLFCFSFSFDLGLSMCS